MKNIELRKKIEDYEKSCRAKEDLNKFIPQLKKKTSQILDVIIKLKRKLKLKTNNEAFIEERKIYEIDPKWLKEQKELIAANRKRRLLKYGKA